MSIGSKMRSLGDSTYFLKAAYEPLKEIMGDKNYVFVKDPINGYVIQTDRIEGKLLENVDSLLNDGFGSNFRKTHYNHNMEISWRNINKYAHCVTVGDVLAVNADYKNDLTSDGEWVYPLPNLKNGKELFLRANIKKINQIFSSLTTGDLCFSWCDKVTEAVLSFPALTSAYRLIYDSDIQVLRLSIPKTLTSIFEAFPYNFNMKEFYCDFSHVTNAQGAFMEYRNLEVLDTDWSALSSASRMFNGSRMPKNIILRVLNTIPSYTSGSHPITLGIHVDHQTDDEVLAAIANAEAKGWVVTVQWNGTPTAQTTSTFGLRKPSIYAKLSEIERPDGSKEQIIDWGHYVSNPEDYEEFSSLEDAYEHFGLPNDLEKLNNSER